MMSKVHFIAAVAGALALAACDGSKDEKTAYDACIAVARKAGHELEKAEFAPFDRKQAAGLQDASIAFTIPYKLGAKDGVYQCAMIKNKEQVFVPACGSGPC